MFVYLILFIQLLQFILIRLTPKNVILLRFILVPNSCASEKHELSHFYKKIFFCLILYFTYIVLRYCSSSNWWIIYFIRLQCILSTCSLRVVFIVSTFFAVTKILQIFLICLHEYICKNFFGHVPLTCSTIGGDAKVSSNWVFRQWQFNVSAVH